MSFSTKPTFLQHFLWQIWIECENQCYSLWAWDTAASIYWLFCNSWCCFRYISSSPIITVSLSIPTFHLPVARLHKALCALTDSTRYSYSYLLGSLFCLKHSKYFLYSVILHFHIIYHLLSLYLSRHYRWGIYLPVIYWLSSDLWVPLQQKHFQFYWHDAVYNDLKQCQKKSVEHELITIML